MTVALFCTFHVSATQRSAGELRVPSPRMAGRLESNGGSQGFSSPTVRGIQMRSSVTLFDTAILAVRACRSDLLRATPQTTRWPLHGAR